MLVVSRRPEESIVFSELGITVTLLNVRGNTARIGIDAPRDVTILRGELADSGATRNATTDRSAAQAAPAPDPQHHIRNVLNSLNLFTMVYRQQLAADQTEAASATFLKMVEYLEKQTQEGAVDFKVETKGSLGIAGQVMIVEDDENQRKLLASLLAMHGLEVTAFDNCREALGALRNSARPDLVLLDWTMPQFGGEWLVPKIREEFGSRSPKLFVVSGLESVTDSLRCSVDAWLPKPLNHEALLARIRAIYPVAC